MNHKAGTKVAPSPFVRVITNVQCVVFPFYIFILYVIFHHYWIWKLTHSYKCIHVHKGWLLSLLFLYGPIIIFTMPWSLQIRDSFLKHCKIHSVSRLCQCAEAFGTVLGYRALWMYTPTSSSLESNHFCLRSYQQFSTAYIFVIFSHF